MADFLTELTNNPTVRSLVKASGLPLPIPAELRRATGAYEERALDRRTVLLTGDGDLGEVAARALVSGGADPVVVFAHHRDWFAGAGANGGLAVRVAADGEAVGEGGVDAIVLDATRIDEPASLRTLYDVLHEWLPALRPSGRVVVLGRPHSVAATAGRAAARRAVEGAVRSVAKEIGRNGSTANLIVVDTGAEDRVAPVLRFLLSARSAFVSGQPLHVSRRAAFDGVAPAFRSLEGQVALVTGAGRGIGEATATRLAEEGADVVCLDRPEDGQLVRQVADRIGATPLLVDVCAADAPTDIALALDRTHGGVDIVVHNAGITRDRTIARMPAESWDSVVGVSLVAAERITTELLNGTLHDGGRIVCLSSVAGIAGNVGQTNYAAAKAGLIGLVEHLSIELADRGITANAVAPGFIETRMTDAVPFMVREGARRLSGLGQGGLPVDVAEAITFLATPGAAGLSGTVLRVCGAALIGA